jgi:hypothetical protein
MIKLKIKHLYIILCFFGIILPYSQLIPLLLEGNFSLKIMIDQLFINRISTLFALDLFVTATVFIVFALYEGVKLKLKHLWIPLLSTLLVGASLGFPLFLLLREINLENNNN